MEFKTVYGDLKRLYLLSSQTGFPFLATISSSCIFSQGKRSRSAFDFLLTATIKIPILGIHLLSCFPDVSTQGGMILQFLPFAVRNKGMKALFYQQGRVKSTAQCCIRVEVTT